MDQIQGNGPNNPAGCSRTRRRPVRARTGGLLGDVIDLSAEAGPVTIVFNANGTITISPAPSDFISGVEGVIGSAGNDTIIGNAGEQRDRRWPW